MPPKELTLMVEYPGGSLPLNVSSNSTVNEVFHLARNMLFLRERWYFGLRLLTGNTSRFLKPKEKISSLLKSGDNQVKLQLGVFLYPEDTSDLIEDVTRMFYFHDVKDQILKEAIYCPPETAVVLASYQAVVLHGKFDPAVHKPGYIKASEYLPPHTLNTHSLTAQQWEAKIASLHKERGDMLPEEAALEYLNVAQELDMYGLRYFPVKKKNNPLLLGLSAMGIFVFSPENKLLPKVNFQWGEIRKITHNRGKLVVKLKDRTAQDLAFQCDSNICKDVLYVSTSYVDLTRLVPMSSQAREIEIMKSSAEQKRLTRESERDRLAAERVAREDAEKRLMQVQNALQRQEDEFERSQQMLANYKQRVQDLENQLEDERRLRMELQRMQQALEEYNQKLEQESATSQEERAKLLSERDKIASEIERQQQLIIEQEAEKRRLEELVNEAKALQAAAANGKQDVEVEQEDLYMGDLALKEELRDVKANRDTDYASQLKSLKEELDATKIKQNLTEVDIQHEINQAHGRDKFKTLRQLRAGNTKARVDLFECL